MKNFFFFTFFISIVSCVQPLKEVAVSTFHKPNLTSVPGRNIKVSYFDSSNFIESVVIDNLGETTVMRFYNSGQMKSISFGKYVDNIESLAGPSINHYSFIMQYIDGEGIVADGGFPETFYLNGNIEYTLVPDETDKKMAKYLKHYENGIVEKEMYFKHFSLDSLFIPVGTWKNYDKSGKMLIETQTTPENIFDLRSEVLNDLSD